MTLPLLLVSLAACGETGDTTATTGGDSTSGTTTTTGDQPTASEATTSTSEPTGSTASASESGSSTSEGTSTGETTGSTTAVETTDSTTAVETTGSTTSESTSGTTGDTTGGTSPLVIAIVDAELWANCMPVVAPDPVMGSWFVEFDNTANPAGTAAIVTSASLSLADADPPVIEPITVAPVESGPIAAGEYVSLEVKKLPGAAHNACQHCGQFYTLALEYDEGGVSHHVEEAVTISCSF